MATPDPRYLSGLPVKKRILAEVAEAISALSGAAPLPRLVSISIGDTPEVAVYIRGQSVRQNRLACRLMTSIGPVISRLKTPKRGWWQ